MPPPIVTKAEYGKEKTLGKPNWRYANVTHEVQKIFMRLYTNPGKYSTIDVSNENLVAKEQMIDLSYKESKELLVEYRIGDEVLTFEAKEGQKLYWDLETNRVEKFKKAKATKASA